MIYSINVNALKITPKVCKKNKEEINGKIKDNKTPVQICNSDLEALKNLPTTHTFSKYRSLIDVRENVLIKGQGLLADSERIEDPKLRRKMPKARSVNLHFYIFSYHGIHDPYYANYQREPMNKPFGIFIDPKAEKLLRTAEPPLPSIATYRDLESSQSLNPLVVNFLLPHDARELLANEVKNLYADIWEYWGGTSQYSRAHWEQLYEFHFFKKVPVKMFLAVIWPLNYEDDENTGERSWDQEELKYIVNFKKRFNYINVYIYEWGHKNPVDEFLKSSRKQADYYLKHNRFIDNTLRWI